MSTFGDVSTLLDDDISPANTKKLRAILCDSAKLKMEVAATVDCKGYLEEMGFWHWKHTNALNIAITSKHMPNVTAMAISQASSNAVNE